MQNTRAPFKGALTHGRRHVSQRAYTGYRMGYGRDSRSTEMERERNNNRYRVFDNGQKRRSDERSVREDDDYETRNLLNDAHYNDRSNKDYCSERKYMRYPVEEAYDRQREVYLEGERDNDRYQESEYKYDIAHGRLNGQKDYNSRKRRYPSKTYSPQKYERPSYSLSNTTNNRNDTPNFSPSSDRDLSVPCFSQSTEDQEYTSEYHRLTEKCDLASAILNFILYKGGIVKYSDLSDFGSSHRNFSRPDDFYYFIEEYGSLFEFRYSSKRAVGETTEEIKASTKVKLCPDFSNDPKSCNGDCNSFHLCKFHVLSSCEMKGCKFGHKLEDEHNKGVRRMFYLHRVSLKNIFRLLRHYKNRCRVTVPIICRYYNNGGCNRPEKCSFLHLCQNFVEENCTNMDCFREHDLREKTVKKILMKYDLDPEEVQICEILELLRIFLNDYREEESSKLLNVHRSLGLKEANIESVGRTDQSKKDGLTHDDPPTNKRIHLNSPAWQKMDQSRNNADNSIMWYISDTETVMQNEDMHKIEEMYQKYEQAKYRTLSVGGKM